jgi:hypothetical protein
MQIEITEKQREQLRGILATHLHNMRNEYIAAHGVDEKRAAFYQERVAITERLQPLFAAPEEPKDEDNEKDTDDEEAEE